MENKKNDKEKKVSKFQFNRTRVTSYLSILIIAIFIIVFSLIPIGLSFEKLFSSTWWTNVVLLIFLAVYGLPYGDSEGTNYYKTRINGAYAIVRNEFLLLVKRLNEKKIITYFPEWLQFHYEKKKELTYKQILFELNLQDDRILKLSEKELYTLKSEILEITFEGETTPVLFDKITEEQYNALISIKHGEIQIFTIDDYNYYLTESDNTSSDIDKQALDATKQKGKNKVIQYGTRIITMILISIIWAGIFIDTASSGGGAPGTGVPGEGPSLLELAQPWFNLLSRLTCLVSSISFGFQTAKINNKIDIFVFDYKKTMLQLFEQEYEDKIFVPVDKHAALEERFKKQEEEKKKALDNVVIPVVNEVPLLSNEEKIIDKKE